MNLVPENPGLNNQKNNDNNNNVTLQLLPEIACDGRAETIRNPAPGGPDIDF
jgi:hypothetical protein